MFHVDVKMNKLPRMELRMTTRTVDRTNLSCGKDLFATWQVQLYRCTNKGRSGYVDFFYFDGV